MLVGAEGVVENGGVINKLGTYQIALCAKALNKPFYVAAESYKFARLYPLNQQVGGMCPTCHMSSAMLFLRFEARAGSTCRSPCFRGATGNSCCTNDNKVAASTLLITSSGQGHFLPYVQQLAEYCFVDTACHRTLLCVLPSLTPRRK